MIVSPTITASTVEQFNDQLTKIKEFAKRIHLDLMDGQFTLARSLEIKDIPEINIPLDIHLMYRNPDAILDQVIDLNPSLIAVHFEASFDHLRLTSKIKESGIKSSLAILQQTSVQNIKQVLNLYDQVIIFSGNLGYQGGKADLTLIDKIKTIKSFSNIEIAWDGGINLDNIETLASSGVEVFNVGGYIQNSANPKNSYDLLLNKLNNTLNP